MMNTRRALLAKIHIAKKDLGLDDDTYRARLEVRFGVTSSKGLSVSDLERVVADFEADGWKPKRAKKKQKKAAASPNAVIEALAKEANFTTAYLNGMARRMFKIDHWRFLPPVKKRKLATAMRMHIRRTEKKAE